jgi:hypothetical protein
MSVTLERPDEAQAGPALDHAEGWTLAGVLANRRWLWRREPFPHVVARDVFRPAVYEEIAQGFRDYIVAGTQLAYTAEHDFVGGPLDETAPASLRFLLSPEWCGVFSSMFGFEPVAHVSAGVHRHRPGGRSGFPHNDVKSERIAALSGTASEQANRLAPAGEGLPCVRGAAVLFYLNNDHWQPGDGGGTGVYRHWSDPVDAPRAVAPPVSNSLLAFACTPFSYHSFLANHVQRDSCVLFLYRTLDSYLEVWGTEGLSQYADG